MNLENKMEILKFIIYKMYCTDLIIIMSTAFTCREEYGEKNEKENRQCINILQLCTQFPENTNI